MCIAQEILENYFELKQTLMKARKEYLKKKVKKEKEEQYLLNMQAPKFRVNNSETILARKHQALIKSSKDIQQMASDHYGYFKAKRQEKVTEKRPNTARAFSSHTSNPDDYTTVNSTLYGKMTKKQYMHTLHPCSKLILDKRKYEEYEGDVKYKYPMEVDKAETKFRLKQTHSLGLVRKKNFVMSNSTGPLERRVRFVGC